MQIRFMVNIVIMEHPVSKNADILGEMSKFNFCGPSFSHSPTESNYIGCDFCRSLTEQF